MATWIKYMVQHGYINLINLDMANRFLHNTSAEQVIVMFNDAQMTIEQKEDPKAYAKVLEYMAQIEQQIK